MLKNIAILLLTGLVLFGLHNYVLVHSLELGSQPMIIKQHFFLVALTLLVYASTHITFKVSPNHTGFVLLGLLLAKMIIAGAFVYKLGWLEEGSPLRYRAVFLVFYFLYTLVMLVLSARLLRRLNG